MLPGKPGSPTGNGPVPQGKGEHIAVVDDEKTVGVLTKAVLKRFGYEATAFLSPDDFLAQFEKDPNAVDVIVTDQTMPSLTGLELAQKLRTSGHNLPIIITTGFSRDLNSEAIAKLGRTAVLSKPYDTKELAMLIRRLLGE